MQTLQPRPEPLGPSRLPGLPEINPKNPQIKRDSRPTNLLTVSIAKPRVASEVRRVQTLSNAISKGGRAVRSLVVKDWAEDERAEGTVAIRPLKTRLIKSISGFSDLRGFSLELNTERSLQYRPAMVRKLV